MVVCSQFNALFKKNLIVMKRNVFTSCCLFLFPIILFVCIALIRKALSTDDIEFQGNDEAYIKNQTSIYPTYSDNSYSKAIADTNYSALGVRYPFRICEYMDASNIGIVISPNTTTNIQLNNKIKEKINVVSGNTYTFNEFSSEKELFDYIQNKDYNVSLSSLCFGIGISKVSNKEYNYTLNYFAPTDRDDEDDDFTSYIPSTLYDSLSPFQTVPMLDQYRQWVRSGYIYMMNVVNNIILEETSGIPSTDSSNRITAGFISMKFPSFESDDFERVLEFIVPFFLVVIYMIPIIIFVFRMIKDKESRVKEGMKIMGMTDLAYFLSYFVQYFIINIIIAILGAIITSKALEHISFGIRFGFLFMYGLTIFGLIYFFQSLIDKSKMAILFSIMVYYIFYFVSTAVTEQDLSNSTKMAAALLSPTCLQIGFSTLAKFETSRIDLDSDLTKYEYKEFSVNNMFLMFFIDFLIYLFLGFYFENVLPHEFGTRKPFWFIFSPSYWCSSKEKADVNDNINSEMQFDNISFQDESNYTNKLKDDEILKLRNIEKVFDDGKKALNGVSLNLYKDEIFALLGHNGAGKSTLINILSGLYEANNGKVIYNNRDMLKNLSDFRKKIGICPQHDVLFPDLTVKEHLELFANFKGVDTKNIEQEIDKILSELEMLSKKDALSKNLSGGQKRKLCIAIALIGNSEVVFLDEPSSGMDITNRRKLWDILKRFTKNRIIILTTHYMEEASVLGKRIGILSGGKMKCTGTPLFLINKFGKNISLTLVKHSSSSKLSKEDTDKNNNEIVSFIKDLFNKHSENNSKEKVECEILSEEILVKLPKNYDNFKLNYKKFFGDLDSNLERLKLKTYSASMPTLEDVFLLISDEIKKGERLMNIKVPDKKELNDSKDHSDNDKGSTSEQRLSNKNKKKMRFDEYDSNEHKLPTGFDKIKANYKSCLVKRYYQMMRNWKIFFVEVLCPIILVIIGLGLSSVEFIKDPPSRLNTIDNYIFDQQAMVTGYSFNNRNTDIKSLLSPIQSRFSFEFIYDVNDDNKNFVSNLADFNNKVYSTYNATRVDKPTFNDSSTGQHLSSYYFRDFNKDSNVYEFITLINQKSSDAPAGFTQFMMTNLINLVNGVKDIKINVRKCFITSIYYYFYYLI